MDQELPATDRASLRLILERWRDWYPRPAAAPFVEGKLRGHSNANYLASDGSARFVVRLNSNAAHLGVDRTMERQVLDDIAGAAYAPAVVYASQDHLVTRFVEGGHLHSPNERRMGHLFAQVHRTPTTVTATLDPLAHVHGYLAQLDPVDTRVLEAFERVASHPIPGDRSMCLCHNDLLLGNVLDAGDRLIAIDWEYARLGDPAFDIAVFAETYQLSTQQLAALLDAYGEPAIAPRVTAFRLVYALIEILWWRLRGRDTEALSPALDNLLQRLA